MLYRNGDTRILHLNEIEIFNGAFLETCIYTKDESILHHTFNLIYIVHIYIPYKSRGSHTPSGLSFFIFLYKSLNRMMYLLMSTDSSVINMNMLNDRSQVFPVCTFNIYIYLNMIKRGSYVCFWNENSRENHVKRH